MKIKDDFWPMVLGYVLLIAVVVGVSMGISALVYGDPLCALKKCVVIKENI